MEPRRHHPPLRMDFHLRRRGGREIMGSRRGVPAAADTTRTHRGADKMIDVAEVILRLGGATLIGAAVGLNRDLHGKPIGVRTLGLVGLASAMATLAVVSEGGEGVNSTDAVSRVIQGVLTG